MPRAQIQTHFSFTKTVNRLHRVAHHEQGAAIIRLPARRKPRQQLVLRQRGILKLIHQQMTNAIVERQRQIGRRIGFAQRAQGSLRHRREIRLPPFAENQFQIRRSQRQQRRQCFHHTPLCFGVRDRRQRTREMQCFDEGAVWRQRGHQSGVALLGGRRSSFFGFARTRRKAGIFVDLLTQRSFLGQRQFGSAAPCREVERTHAGQRVKSLASK